RSRASMRTGVPAGLVPGTHREGARTRGRLPQGRKLARIRAGNPESERIPVRGLTMPEHVRFTRNRREFLTDAFCGFGSLAFAQLAHAASVNPLSAKTPENPAKAKAVIFLFM